MAFSDFMKKIRSERNITQANMAEILNVSVTAIKLIENGSTKFPSEKVLSNLSSYLHITELDVATNILFPNVEKDREVYAAVRYMVHKYLDGWNIDNQPAVVNVKDMDDMIFMAKMSKRRETNNTILLDAYATIELSTKDLIVKQEAIGFVSFIITAIICMKEYIRGYHLVFDARKKRECLAFVVFDALELNRLPFDFEIVLYNPDENKILKVRNLR